MSKNKIKKLNKKDKSNAEKVERYFIITKIFLAVTPLLAYAYVSYLSTSQGLTLQELLALDPSITIAFIISMLNPYVAYLLDLVEKKLKDRDYLFVVTNMILLLIAQAMTLNLFYFMMVAVVFYKTIKVYKIDIRQVLQQLNLKNTFVMGGGSAIVVSLSTICLLASIQIM